MHRTKTMALMFLLGAFLAGGALGFAADRVTEKSKRDRPNRAEYRERFARELGLTADQRRVIDSLMESNRARVRALYAPIKPTMDSIAAQRDSIFSGTQRELRGLLRPDQQSKFDRMQERARKDRGRHGPRDSSRR